MKILDMACQGVGHHHPVVGGEALINLVFIGFRGCGFWPGFGPGFGSLSERVPAGFSDPVKPAGPPLLC